MQTTPPQNAVDAAREQLEKRQKNSVQRLGAFFRGGYNATDTKLPGSFSSLPISTKASGALFSFVGGAMGMDSAFAGVIDDEILARGVGTATKAFVSAFGAKASQQSFVRDWMKPNPQNSIDYTFERFEKIANKKWSDDASRRINQLRRRRFFRTPALSRYAGASYSSMAADTIELRKLYELRHQEIQKAAKIQSDMTKEAFGLEEIDERNKFRAENPAPPGLSPEDQKTFYEMRKQIMAEESAARYSKAKGEFNSYTPHLNRGMLGNFLHGVGNLFMPSQFQTNNLDMFEKLKFINSLSQPERAKMFSPWRNWGASLKSITVDPFRNMWSNFKIRNSVGNPFTAANPIINSTIAEHEFASRVGGQIGEYVDAFGDEADPRNKHVKSMFKKYGPKMMEYLGGGAFNLGFGAYSMYTGRDEVGVDRYATATSMSTWNLLFATGIDNYLTKGWGAGKAVGSFIGQTAYTASYGAAKAGSFVGRSFFGGVYNAAAGLGGRAAAANASIFGRGVHMGSYAAGAMLNTLGKIPYVGAPFRAPGALGSAYASVAGRAPKMPGIMRSMGSLTNIGLQGVVKGVAGLAGGVAGFIGVGMAGELPAIAMRAIESNGRDLRMRRDLAMMEQAMPNYHLTNQFSKHVLATERQRALAFSRQSGVAMNSIMGREAVIFHQ